MSTISLYAELVLNKSLLEYLDEIANCNICKNIVWNPMKCSKCEHCFCKSCIDNWLSQSHSCPFKCKGMEFKESRMARSLLSNLLFKCAQCGEVIKYENFDNHIRNCPYQIDRNENRTIKKKSKFEKYDEVETEDHEHILTIVKDNKMMSENDSKSDNSNNNAVKYFWTCNVCKKNFALDVKSAYCDQCGYEECEECIANKENQWFVHIVI